MKEMWGLQGYDAYDGEFYSLPGQFTSELDAQKRVFILRPDGTQYRFLPVTEEQQEKLQE